MQDIGLLKMNPEKENNIDILIRVFEAQLRDVEPQISSGASFQCFHRKLQNCVQRPLMLAVKKLTFII
jgi:hypothetical protein